jgi:PAS domain S-box-containing protein
MELQECNQEGKNDYKFNANTSIFLIIFHQDFQKKRDVKMKIRILIVDDDEDLLFLAEQYLSRQERSMELVLVQAAQEALRMLEEESFDAVICDFNLGPGEMNGLEILEWLRGEGHSIPFIIFTGHSREEVAIQALNLGADYYIEKGDDLESLFTEIGHHVKSVVRNRRTEEALHESEQRYRTLVQSMSDLIFVLDEDDCFSQYHSIASTDLLAAPGDFLGKHIGVFLPPEITEQYLELAEDVRSDGLRKSFDYEMKINGAKRWYSADLDLHENGESIVATIAEITDRKQAENELRNAEREWRNTFDSIPDLVSVLNSDFQIIKANKTMAEELGIDQDELVGKKCYEVMHKSSEPFPGCPHHETAKTGQPASAEIHDITMGEPYLITTSPIHDEHDEQIGVVHIAKNITERVQAEETIKESESRFRALFEHAGIGMALVRSGEVLEANSGLQEFLGYDADDLVGMTITDISHPEDAGRDASELRRIIENNEDKYQMEKRYIRKDGEAVWARLTVSLIRDADGTPQYTIGMVEDISETKAAQSALKESESRLRAIFEQAGIGMALVLMDGKIVEANMALQEFLGYDIEEILEMNTNDFTHPEDIEKDNLALQNMLKAKETRYQLEKRYIRKDGETVWGRLTVSLIKDAEGSPQYTVGMVEDITEHKKTEILLIEERDRVKTYLDLAGIVILATDTNLDITMINGTGCKILGLAEEEILGKNWIEAFIPGWKQEEIRNYMNGIITGQIEPSKLDEGPVLDASGNIHWIQWSDVIVREKDGKVIGILSAGPDITEKKQAEEELRDSEARFRLIFDLAPIGVSQAGMDGDIHRINMALEEMLGYTNEELIEMKVESFTHPDDWKAELKLNQELFDGTRDSYTIEKRYFHKNGDIVWGRLNVSIKRDAEGAPEFVIGMVEDITQEIRMRNELQSSEEFLSTIFKESPIAIEVYDSNGVFIRGNLACIDLFGLEDEKTLEGHNIFNDPNITDEGKQRMRNGETIRFEDVYSFDQIRKQNVFETSKSGDGYHESVIAPLGLDHRGIPKGFILQTLDITERVDAEEQLRESEERFRTVFEQAGIGMTIVGSDDHIIAANSKYQEMVGYTLEELRQMKISEYTHPEDVLVDAALFEEVLEGKRSSYQMIKRYITKKGDTIWVSLTVTVIKDEHGNVTFIVGMTEDITARRKAETALRESEEKYRTLIENIQNGIQIAQDGISVYANEVLAEMLGYSIDELVGSPFANLIAPEDLDWIVDRYRKRLIGEQVPSDYEVRLLHKDGSHKYAHLKVANFEYEGKLSTIATIMDITDRRKAEDELRESEQRYRLLYENLSDGLFITNLEGIITMCSPQGSQIYGTTPENIVGTHISKYIHPEDRERLMGDFKNGISNKVTLAEGHEVRGIKEDGSEFYFHITNTLLLENDEPIGYQSLVRDTTNFKRVESALRESELRNRQIVESTPMGFHIYELDAEDNLIFIGANSAADKLLGIDNSQFIGKTIEDAFPSAAQTEIPNKYKEVALKGVAWSSEQIDYEDDKISGAFEVHAFQISPRRMVASFLDITVRKETEQAIALSQDNLQTLFDTIDDLLFIVGLDARVQTTNQSVRKLLGYSEEELVGIDVLLLHPPERREEAAEILKEMIKGKTTRCPVPMMAKDGTIIPVETRITLGKWDGKEVLFGVSRDITVHIEIEDELKESEMKYRSLVENMPIVAWTSDEEGNTVYLSPTVADIYGFTPEEIYNTGQDLWFSRIHPEDLSRVKTAYKQSFDDEGGFNVEYRIRRKDGEWIWLHDRTIGIYEHNGKKYASGIFADITERKRVMQEVQDERDRTAKYLDIAGSIILTLDTTGLVTLINQKGCDILGYDREEIIGQNWIENFVPDRLKDEIKQVHANGIAGRISEIEEYENPIQTKTGEEKIIAWRNVSLVNKDGNIVGALSSGIDITQMRTSEQILERHAHELDERVKELTCLYDSLKLLHSSNSIEDIFKPLVESMQAAWQYPEITNVRISYQDQEYKSSGFRESQWKQTADINISGEIVGAIEVNYLEEKPVLDEGPFLKEERHLIDALAQNVSNCIEHRAIEKDLRTEKEFTEAAVNAQRDTFFVFDPVSGKAVRWNGAFREISGYTDVEISSLKAPDSYYGPEDLEIAARCTESLMNGGTEILELSLVTKDGNLVPFEYSASTIFDESGKPSYIVSVGRNITDRKQSETKIEKHVIFLENVLEALSHPFYVIDPVNYRIELANKAARLGELTETSTCHSITHKNEKPCSETEHPCPLEEVKRTKKPVIVEHTHYDESGRIRDMEIHAHPILDESGNLIQMIEYALDVTDQKKALRNLEEGEKRFRLLYENAPLGYQTLDEDGHFLEINSEWLNALGYKREEVVGKSFREFISSTSKQTFEKTFSEFKEKGEISNIEFELICKDGSILIARFNGRVTYDEFGSFIQTHCIFQDVTDWKIADNVLRRQKEELSELAHMMSHDLGNKMSNIRSLITLLQHQYDKDVLERIDGIAKRTALLLKSSATLADAGVVIKEKERVDLNDMVSEAASTIIPSIVTFKKDSLPIVFGSPERIGQIIQNLFVNAIEHGNPRNIEVKKEETDKGIDLLIINDGKSVPIEIRDKIFRRGFTTKEGGTGLGLSIVKKMVEAHGWQITLDPSPTTTFRISIG